MELETLATFAKGQLSKAQRQFNKRPNAHNWNECLIAMLVWQQTEQLTAKRPAYAKEREEVLQRAADMQQEFWGELIVRTVTGKSIGQVLAEA
jgi:hypothetical protein